MSMDCVQDVLNASMSRTALLCHIDYVLCLSMCLAWRHTRIALDASWVSAGYVKLLSTGPLAAVTVLPACIGSHIDLCCWRSTEVTSTQVSNARMGGWFDVFAHLCDPVHGGSALRLWRPGHVL